MVAASTKRKIFMDRTLFWLKSKTLGVGCRGSSGRVWLLARRAQGEFDQRLFFELVGLCGTGCRRSSGGAFDGEHAAVARVLLQQRKGVGERTHVGRLFLYPDDLFRVGVLLQSGGDLLLRPGVELLHEDDRGGIVPALGTFDAEVMTDLAGADEDALWIFGFVIREDVLELRSGEVRNRRDSIRMAQHALRCEDDERLAERRQRLAAEQVEVLRRVRRLRDDHVVRGTELQIAFDACGGVLRSLAFVAMRQKHDDAREQMPLGFARSDELVDDDLRAVGEVAELRLPEGERLRIIARVAVLEAEHCGLGQHRVVDLEATLAIVEVLQRRIAQLRLGVDEDGVALIEGAALRVLSGEADGRTGLEYRSVSNELGHAVVEGTRSRTHLFALLQERLDLGMDVKVRRIADELLHECGYRRSIEAGWDVVGCVEVAALVRLPVGR